MGYQNQKDITGFIAEFGTDASMERAILKAGVTIPEGWVKSKDNFIVKEDGGRVLTIQFYDFDREQEYGEEFDVNYDDVHCWA